MEGDPSYNWKRVHRTSRSKITRSYQRHCTMSSDVGKGLVTTIPSLLWDLNQHNHRYLYNRTELVTSIQKKNTDQGIIYLIRTNKLPAANNVQWALVLEDPATALECLHRHWGPHFVDIANQLCSCGHPFSTCIPGSSPIAQP